VVILIPQEYLIKIILILPITSVLAWCLLDTKYILHETYLAYKSGPFRGKISYRQIRKVEVDDSFFKAVILKPGLGIKGLIVRYDRFEEIYISPENRADFIAELKKRVPNLMTE
jgi:hypothetical protein